MVVRILPQSQCQTVVMVLLSICSPSYYHLSCSYYLEPLVQRWCDPLLKGKVKDVLFFITRFTYFNFVKTVIPVIFCMYILAFIFTDVQAKRWSISFVLNVQIGWHKSHQQKAPRWNSGSSPLSVSKSCCNLGESKSCNKWKRLLCCVLLDVC